MLSGSIVYTTNRPDSVSCVTGVSPSGSSNLRAARNKATRSREKAGEARLSGVF